MQGMPPAVVQHWLSEQCTYIMCFCRDLMAKQRLEDLGFHKDGSKSG